MTGSCVWVVADADGAFGGASQSGAGHEQVLDLLTTQIRMHAICNHAGLVDRLAGHIVGDMQAWEERSRAKASTIMSLQ